jgi:Ca-activated chloride channel homolog
MIRLAHPLALLLLAAVPVYLFGYRRALASFPLPRSGSGEFTSRRVLVLSHAPAALRTLALVLIAIALTRPLTAGAVLEETREGVPIALAIDISSSMLAQDFRPRDRLEVAKSTIGRFIEAREGDPVALVAFAGEALTLVPATTQRAVLAGSIESLRVGLVEDGTAIGDGLATAINRVRTVGDGSGVVVLLSDGENNRGQIDPLAAADAAAAIGVRVFTVGVGSEGVAPVPVGSAPAGFRYAELPVGLDEDLLREIAQRTGGAYFRATDPGALERIYRDIDALVPSTVEVVRHIQTREWAAFLLLGALALLALEWGLRASRWGAVP